MNDYWAKIASQWNQLGPPLRPSARDTDFVAGIVRKMKISRALILGVTPELYRLPWPAGAIVSAVDHSQTMIDAVWPGPREQAYCADWTQIPDAVGQNDIILCDGGLSLLPFPDQHLALISSLHRVLSPGGICVFRLYVPPPQPESTEAVLDDFLAGKIGNLNLLKLRLWTSFPDSATAGVELNQVWEAVHEVAPDLIALADRIGWASEQLLAINAYRECADRYYFPSVARVCDCFCGKAGGFRLESVNVPDYELGERCPTIVMRMAS